MKKVLILSSKNEARSHMAEKWLKYYGKKHLEVVSAGLEKGIINVMAQKAMAEAVMDIPEYKAKSISAFQDTNFDFVLCFDAKVKENMIELNGNPEVLLFELPDPAKVEGDKEVRQQAYNAICNAVEDICFGFVQDRFQIVA
ncbi:hypothetical protein L3049_17395 [Labilibaculum sp. DW002]|uniref:Phosphotyrosine protein phosphatase I domain-containing protein n=1 Tax=Paralabilibaculum antarcticum TaxID=2912572 RepID=A0ABT5VYA3_9BACT|nr:MULTISPECIES: hypothetical protein [unclassified Labilibaculum]MBI9059021.1 hypothetical protein [Labilibaculum sp.]MDE5419772.1 hypothetical protein [Labilibaculum sp. DW002]